MASERDESARYRILGPVEVRPGQDWQPVRAAKQRSLLAALLLRPGRIVSAGQLIADMWGDDPPESAAKAISVHVFKLRQLLADPEGGTLATRAPGYQLNCGPGELDAAVFEARAAEGRRLLAAASPAEAARVLAAALELWRGTALADVPRTGQIGTEAGRLEEARLAALELRIEADLRCGRHDEVVPELRKLTGEYPLREGIWLLLLQALAAGGRHAEAVAAYGQARAAIGEELGTEPGPALREMFQLLLSGGQPAAGPGSRQAGRAAAAQAAGPGPAADAQGPPAQLPPDVPDFTGRAEHVDRLRRLLVPRADAGSAALPVVVVSGTPGLGKTALAVHAAHAMRGAFADGQLYVSLRGAGQHPAAPHEVLARFLRDLGVPPARIPEDPEERAAMYRTRTAGRRLLVLLDDAASAAQVRPLLPGGPPCAVLVTSRHRLADLAGARLLDLETLDEAEGGRLFSQIVGGPRAAAEPGSVAQVLAACAGLPLAIRIAAARLAARPGWNIGMLAARLADTRRRMDELATGDLAVRACFEVSFSALRDRPPARGTDPAQAFRLLGLWPGPSLSLEACAALLGQRPDEVEAALEELVDAHLLDCPVPGRYSFHDLLRAYAAELAAAGDPQQAAAAEARVLGWYLRTAAAAAAAVSPHGDRLPLGRLEGGGPALRFAGREDGLAWCATERGNLVAATRQAARLGLHEIAWKLPATIMVCLYLNGSWDEWIITHEIARVSARALGDRRGEARVLNNLGMALVQRQSADGLAYLEQAVAICQQIGDRRGQARAANNLGFGYGLRGRYQEAAAAQRAVLALQREVGNSYGEGIALCNLGETCLELGQLDEAVTRSQDALTIARELSEERIKGFALRNIGRARLELGEPARAQELLGQAAAGHRGAGDRYAMADDLRYLGQAQAAAGDPDSASASWREAAGILESLGEQPTADELAAAARHLQDPG